MKKIVLIALITLVANLSFATLLKSYNATNMWVNNGDVVRLTASGGSTNALFGSYMIVSFGEPNPGLYGIGDFWSVYNTPLFVCSWSATVSFTLDSGTNLIYEATFVTSAATNVVSTFFGTITNFRAASAQKINLSNADFGPQYLWLEASSIKASRIIDPYVRRSELTVVSDTLTQYMATNLGSGGSGGSITNIVFTNTVTLPAGSAATVTNVGVVGGIAYFQLSVPAGNPGTNTQTNLVTIYSTTNAIENSCQITYFNTNRLWSSSNYLARVPGLYKILYQPGNDGANPPRDVEFEIRGSYNGSNSWFAITNWRTFSTTNTITIVSTNAPGSPGSCTLYTFQNWAAIGRTNYIQGQHLNVDLPTLDTEVANKRYVDSAAANAAASAWQFETATNGQIEYYYAPNGDKVFGMSQAASIYSTNISFAIDGTGTNWLLTVATNNLVTGWQVQFSPDLLYRNGWNLFTNYTLTTNSGIATFKIPQYVTWNLQYEAGFFRIVSPQVGWNVAYYGLELRGGALYPSNTWNFKAITNQMPNFSTWVGSSNGQPGVITLWKSNAAAYYLVVSNGLTLRVPAQ